MPHRISKHQVLAKLCNVASGETWAIVRGLKDRIPTHSGWSNRLFGYNPTYKLSIV